MKKFTSMLALAALAVLAVACSNDKGGSGTSGTKTDTSSTTDTGAKDTGTADTTAKDTATADTSMADMNMGGDVSATTDTATTTDTTTTTDTATAGGGCTDDSDKKFLAGLQGDKAKSDAFAKDVKDCTLTKGCLAKTTDSDKIKCISDCIEGLHKADGLQDSCSACYGLTGWCGAGPCLAKCAVDPSSKDCSDCLATNCDPAANACKAGTCDPYAANHCKP